MNFPEPQPHPYPAFDTRQPIEARKPGWSTAKKVGVALGGLVALGAVFLAGTTLGVGIGYDSAKADIAASFDDAFGESFTEPVTGDYRAEVAEDPLSAYPAVLSAGGSVDVPCSMYAPEEGVCMTLTLTNIDPNTVCSSSYADPGRYVALTFDASMPVGADSEFSSPFRSSPWSVVTEDNRITNTRADVGCDLSSNYLDLMAEFPGYSATGTAWLPVPDNATEVHFEAGHEHLFTVPLG